MGGINVNQHSRRKRGKDRVEQIQVSLEDFYNCNKLNIKIDSDDALAFNDKLFEFYSKTAIRASSNLARERGSYKSYMGSLWDQTYCRLIAGTTFRSTGEREKLTNLILTGMK